MADFVRQMQWLVDVAYPDAPVVRVVLDNLNIHRMASLYETFPDAVHQSDLSASPAPNGGCYPYHRPAHRGRGAPRHGPQRSGRLLPLSRGAQPRGGVTPRGGQHLAPAAVPGSRRRSVGLRHRRNPGAVLGSQDQGPRYLPGRGPLQSPPAGQGQ